MIFDDGLEVTIPNELLVVPEKLIDDSGEVQVNSTFAEVLIGPTTEENSGDTPRIGKQFFSSTYIFVDFDAGTFTVWQANSTSDSRLVSVGGDCDAVETQEAPVSSSSAVPLPEATNSRQTESSETATDTSQDDGSLSTGVIVGIAVGGAAALAVVATIAFMCLVRRKKRRQQSEKGLLSDSSAHGDYKHTDYSNDYARHELHNVATSELEAAKVARELDAGREARELDGVESKHGYMGYKSRNSPHQVYELATRTP